MELNHKPNRVAAARAPQPSLLQTQSQPVLPHLLGVNVAIQRAQQARRHEASAPTATPAVYVELVAAFDALHEVTHDFVEGL